MIERLAEAGVPVGVMVAPVIPALTDHELESILEKAANAGAEAAGFVIFRLPHEVAGLFKEWLHTHEPLKATHVISERRDQVIAELADSGDSEELDMKFCRGG